MEISRNKLIDDLMEIVNQARAAACKFKNFRNDQLNYKPGPEEWSILECLEHLNLYGDYYLPEIGKQIRTNHIDTSDEIFKSGFIGNYFATLIQVKNGKIKRKLHSPKDKNPANSKLTPKSIDRFIKQLDSLDSLLAQSRKIDLIKTKTAVSITRFIRLRLGDTLRFFVYHIERHIVQAERIEIALNRRVLV
jgi:hypothetical protein